MTSHRLVTIAGLLSFSLVSAYTAYLLSSKKATPDKETPPPSQGGEDDDGDVLRFSYSGDLLDAAPIFKKTSFDQCHSVRGSSKLVIVIRSSDTNEFINGWPQNHIPWNVFDGFLEKENRTPSNVGEIKKWIKNSYGSELLNTDPEYLLTEIYSGRYEMPPFSEFFNIAETDFLEDLVNVFRDAYEVGVFTGIKPTHLQFRAKSSHVWARFWELAMFEGGFMWQQRHNEIRQQDWFLSMCELLIEGFTGVDEHKFAVANFNVLDDLLKKEFVKILDSRYCTSRSSGTVDERASTLSVASNIGSLTEPSKYPHFYKTIGNIYLMSDRFVDKNQQFNQTKSELSDYGRTFDLVDGLRLAYRPNLKIVVGAMNSSLTEFHSFLNSEELLNDSFNYSTSVISRTFYHFMVSFVNGRKFPFYPLGEEAIYKLYLTDSHYNFRNAVDFMDNNDVSFTLDTETMIEIATSSLLISGALNSNKSDAFSYSDLIERFLEKGYSLNATSFRTWKIVSFEEETNCLTFKIY